MEILLLLVALIALGAFFAFKKKRPSTPEAEDEPTPRPLTDPVPKRPAEPAASQVEPVIRQAPEPTPEESTQPNFEPPASPPPTSTLSAAPAPEILLPLDAGGDPLPFPSIAPLEDPAPPPPPVRGQREAQPSHVDLQSLRKGLARSRDEGGFFGRLKALISGKREIAPEISDEIEELLLTSDVGVKTTERILQNLRDRLSRGELKSQDRVWEALREEACRIVDIDGKRGPIAAEAKPTVILFVGVNGAGKTTTIGKLAQKLTSEGKKVALAAGDTFRAAAVDQLKAWGARTGATVISGKEGADPSSVLFDAIAEAQRTQVDFLLADTAGRLHTKTNLMQEMTKIERTAAKALSGAPHEIFLVIDATNGQNAMAQAKEFKEALNVSGLILTKLDGTAKGGVVLGICDVLGVPVRYVGLGERAEDLQEFGAAEFVEALLGADGNGIAA